MAAVRSPMVPSPSSGFMSAFSPYTDSPSSPQPQFNGKRSSADSSGRLQPQPQKSPQVGSPSDIPDPSPIASSNGTDTTDFDDAPAVEDEGKAPAASGDTEPNKREPIKIATTDADGKAFRPSSSEDDYPSSVIHAPKKFEPFGEVDKTTLGRITPTPSQRSDITVVTPSEDEIIKSPSPLSPPPISTAVPPTHDVFSTPRAQTRQEAETVEQERAAKMKASALEDIPERDADADAEDAPDAQSDKTLKQQQRRASDIAALREALTQCWTLCNSLAQLSHIHRKRAFRHTKRRDGREQAWETCWTLCQKLYNTWDDEQPAQVATTLNMCREFCQSLFEVRQVENDVADSVLRVSFELNNHLYNTHDRALPEAFRERTLDFYITLCHRLMKQRNKMGEETDDLLRACWSLAEMLFSLRQNKREGEAPDEELLGSAVQACWELCDLFREGWTQVRPDRGTPRPSQATFTPVQNYLYEHEAIPVTVDETEYEDDDVGRLNPETPTTIFEDTNQMSPDDDASVPNIVVLGPESQDSRYSDWSSEASSRSGYESADEQKTSSSTATVSQGARRLHRPGSPAEDPRLTCLKLLIVRAATNLGFGRGEPLAAFVKSLPSNSFGTAPWQMALLDQYKQLVAADPAFQSLGPPRRATAEDVAKSVRWMVAGGQVLWLGDLFRWVFGFRLDEAAGRPGLSIAG